MSKYHRNIQPIRVAANMTQAELGRIIGKSGGVVSNLENGKTPLLFEEAVQLAKELDFSLDWFALRNVGRNNHDRKAVVEDVIAALPSAVESGKVSVPQYIPDWANGHNLAQALRNRHTMTIEEALNRILKELDAKTADPEATEVKEMQAHFSFFPLVNWAKRESQEWRLLYLRLTNMGFVVRTNSDCITLSWGDTL